MKIVLLILLLGSLNLSYSQDIDSLTIHVVRPYSKSMLKASRSISFGDTLYYFREGVYASIKIKGVKHNTVPVSITYKNVTNLKIDSAQDIYLLLVQVGIHPFKKLRVYELSAEGFRKTIEDQRIRKGERELPFYKYKEPQLRIR